LSVRGGRGSETRPCGGWWCGMWNKEMCEERRETPRMEYKIMLEKMKRRWTMKQ
jgi:hypothetical protein